MYSAQISPPWALSRHGVGAMPARIENRWPSGIVFAGPAGYQKGRRNRKQACRPKAPN
jgi:hypothetical protein